MTTIIVSECQKKGSRISELSLELICSCLPCGQRPATVRRRRIHTPQRCRAGDGESSDVEHLEHRSCVWVLFACSLGGPGLDRVERSLQWSHRRLAKALVFASRRVLVVLTHRPSRGSSAHFRRGASHFRPRRCCRRSTPLGIKFLSAIPPNQVETRWEPLVANGPALRAVLYPDPFTSGL